MIAAIIFALLKAGVISGMGIGGGAAASGATTSGMSGGGPGMASSAAAPGATGMAGSGAGQAGWNGVAGSGAGWNGVAGSAAVVGGSHPIVPIVPLVAGGYRQHDEERNGYADETRDEYGNNHRPMLQTMRSNSSQQRIMRKSVASDASLSGRGTTASPVSFGGIPEVETPNYTVIGSSEHPSSRSPVLVGGYGSSGGYAAGDMSGYSAPSPEAERFEAQSNERYEAGGAERYEAPDQFNNGRSYAPYRPS